MSNKIQKIQTSPDYSISVFGAENRSNIARAMAKRQTVRWLEFMTLKYNTERMLNLPALFNISSN